MVISLDVAFVLRCLPKFSLPYCTDGNLSACAEVIPFAEFLVPSISLALLRPHAVKFSRCFSLRDEAGRDRRKVQEKSHASSATIGGFACSKDL